MQVCESARRGARRPPFTTHNGRRTEGQERGPDRTVELCPWK